MTEFVIFPEPEDEPELPSYSDPGRILFEIQHVYRSPSDRDNYEIEEIDYDGSVYWLREGMGIEYFLDECLDLDDVGFYVMEGVTGRYIRGDGWTTDDDEEWEWDFIRRADPEEIEAEALRDA